MPETRISKLVLEWKSGEKKLDKPQRNWQSGMNEDMSERGIEEDL